MPIHLPIVTRTIPAALARPTDGPTLEPLADSFGRQIRYLRISLTDRCNYRCAYCMPEDAQFRPRADLLTFEEIVRLVGVFARRGVRRVRLTGGEPTVRSHVVDLVGMVAAVPGIDAVVMTTNGQLLSELAGPLAAAGLAGINVSVDTLDPTRFRAITRLGDLDQVIAGIAAARAAGIPVKINAVALVEHADEIGALAAFGWSHGGVTRFIEHMPMSDGRLYSPENALTAAQIRAAVVAAHGPIVHSGAQDPHSGPSRYWHLADDPSREIGIISAMTEHFCDSCNRLRITATGDLHACLGHDDAVSLRDILRSGGSDRDVESALALSIDAKRAGHEFVPSGAGGPSKNMVSIGG